MSPSRGSSGEDDPEGTLPFGAMIAVPGQDATLPPPTTAAPPEEPLRTIPFGTILGPMLTRAPTPPARARSLPARLEPGALLDSFVLGQRLGSDPHGLGQRWSASHPQHGSCQVLALGEAAAAAFGRRYLLRTQLLLLCDNDSTLERPLELANLPQPWVALPYRAVPSLEATLRRGPLDPPRAAQIMLALARGLVTLQAANRMHGDPHPAHVELPPDGGARWTGLARVAHINEHGVRQPYPQGPPLGDVTYLAPEVIEALGGKKRPRIKANVYAVGAMLFECLLGRPPFAGTPAEVLHAARELDVPQPAPESLPPALQTKLARRLLPLAFRMLAKDPHLRPAPRELVVQLEAAIEDRDLRAPREADAPVWPWALGCALFLAAAAAALLLLRA